VDLQSGKLSVRRTLSAAKGKPEFAMPQSGNSRDVPLTAQAIETLKRHRKHQLEARRKGGEHWQDHGLVFCTSKGTPLNRHNIHRRSFKPLLERAGLPLPFRFQDLRHTFAILMLRDGEGAEVVQEILGHASIYTTLDTYSHVLADMHNTTIDRRADVPKVRRAY
jgi:integrase